MGREHGRFGRREVVGDPMLRADGTLVLYTGEYDLDAMTAGSLMRLTSADNGETWTEEDTGWGELVGGPVLQVLEAADGTVCLTCVTQRLDDRGQNEYGTYLVQPGGQPEAAAARRGRERQCQRQVCSIAAGNALVFVVSQLPGTGCNLRVGALRPGGQDHDGAARWIFDAS